MYPQTRLRRNRKHAWLRDMLAENAISSNDLILPVFVQEGENKKTPIKSMPNIYRYSVDRLLEHIKEASDLDINAIALFPVVPSAKKDSQANEAVNKNNLACRATNAIKNKFPQLGVICDVALDPYTSHGQDGVIDNNGYVLNDQTVEILSNQAVCLADAGCDIVAPSDMMDGRVGAIRKALDANLKEDVAILSYAAKYASAFYGPFRDAVGSGENLKNADKKSYQMNPANSIEALREIELDIKEGADMVMVKPAIPYLDIIKQSTQSFNIPVLAYHVSGEYAMLKAASANGWLDYEKCLSESIICMKRAGAKAILTYGAIDLAKIL